MAHESPGLPAVEAHPVNIDGEVRHRIGADVEGEVLARANAGSRGVALDRRAPVAGRRVDPSLGQHPVSGARVEVLEPDFVGPAVMGQRGCHSIQSERSRCPGQRFHGRPTGDRVRVHHLLQSLHPPLARCTWRVLYCLQEFFWDAPDAKASDALRAENRGWNREQIVLGDRVGSWGVCGSSRAATQGSSPVGLCGGLARMQRNKAAAVGSRSRRRINMLQHVKEGRKSENSMKDFTLTERRLM